MAGRLVAVWAVAIATGVLSALALLRLSGPLATAWLSLGSGLAIMAGVLASRGRLRGVSPGARDNGSGVVAALVAAEGNRDVATGILITSAEEFGLVGARVFATLVPNLQEMEFINLDTLDQEGKLYVVSHDGKGKRFGHELESHLATLNLPIEHRRLPWGILVDSAPFARAQARSVTLGRLTWATLRRIHTPHDTAQDLSLSTAEQIGRAIVSN
jgi:Zn-dependent M28 family amino/carboxypeptidase